MKEGYRIGQIVTFINHTVHDFLRDEQCIITKIDVENNSYTYKLLTGPKKGSKRLCAGNFWIEEPGSNHNRNGANSVISEGATFSEGANE